MFDGLEERRGVVFPSASRKRGEGFGFLATLVRDSRYLILNRCRLLLLRFLLFLFFFAL